MYKITALFGCIIKMKITSSSRLNGIVITISLICLPRMRKVCSLSGNCDFEASACGYTDSSTGLYEWGRASPAGSPPVDPSNSGRGPRIDNTKKTNQGKFHTFEEL